MIPYGRQDIDAADVEAVTAVLRAERLTQGPAVEAFERAIAERCDVAHAVAMNSATSALHVACLALGVGPGDVVWTTPITFVASANAALLCGATVDFVDIDPHTWNLCPRALEQRLRRTRQQDGRLPHTVIVVHFAGEPADLARIAELGREYGFRIVEDAAHALGARYEGKPVGACAHSDITVFSFHPVKIITTAEGGLATTRCARLAESMRALRTNGVWRSRPGSGEPFAEPWHYEQHALGGNYRMSDLQAALGSSQLERLDDFIAHRHALAKRYDRLLAELPFTLPYREPLSHSALHLYPVLLDANVTRLQVFERMTAAGIGVNVHYIPVHLQPFHRARHPTLRLPAAEDYYARTLTLPLFGTMTFEQQDRVVAALRRALDCGALSRAA